MVSMQFKRIGAMVGLGLALTGLLWLAWSGVAAGRVRAARTTALDVVINEVAWMGTAANANHEWIELYNNTAVSITLTGWQLSDGGDISVTLSGSIAPGGYFLLERTTDTTVSDILANQIYAGALSNTGEVLTLTNNLGEVIDVVNGKPWPAGNNTSPKWTMERIDPTAPSAAHNWVTSNGIIRNGLDASGNPINGTPRARNSPGLALRKSGPTSFTSGDTITCYIVISNAGGLPLGGILLTDTLPAGLALLGQTSPFTWSQPLSNVLVWQVGELPGLAWQQITLTLGSDPALSGWITNVATAGDALGRGAGASWSMRAVPDVPQPGLALRKSGPTTFTPGLTVTHFIVISNTGDLPLSGILLTDVLPTGLTLLGQTSPFTLSQPAANVLVWQVGTMPTATRQAITLTLRAAEWSSGRITNTVTAAGMGLQESASWGMRAVPGLRLYALHPYALRTRDEALALINVGSEAVDLSGWGISDGKTTPDATLPALTLPPGGILWVADQAEAFWEIFGFWPDAAQEFITHAVPLLTGTWPGLTNTGDEALLFDPMGQVIDTLVYGSGITTTTGWRGAAVTYPLSGFGSGQILMRKRDESSGRPWPDTDTAMDWLNDTSNGPALYGPVTQGDLYGKRPIFPGWDWDVYTRTLQISATAHLTVGIAPDNLYTVTAQLLQSARQSIVIELYTLESIWLTHILTERIRAGVQVTVLLEGAPTGGLAAEELWYGKQIVDAGGRVYWMHNDSTAKIYDRYDYVHAKFAVIDSRLAAIGSENWGNHAMPVDPKDNGTAGNRGVLLITDQQDVVNYLLALFARDCDPTAHLDVVAYGALPRYTASPGFTPVYSTGGGFEYPALFSVTAPLMTADWWEVIQSPETSLRYGDGLIGLVRRAAPGDALYVEQMYERVSWTNGPNPRLEAYIEAARRGAAVRILLDKGFDDQRKNYDTAFYLMNVAQTEGLDLQVRLGNPTARGIHNKMALLRRGGEKFVHISSINGSADSSLVNREVGLQIRSGDAFDYLKQVFDYDWEHGAGPLEVFLPLVMREYVPVADHILISEVMFKQAGSGEEMGEWIELYNPTARAVDIGGWLLGDAVLSTDYERLYLFPAGTVIAPGGTLVIARRAADYQAWGYASKPLPDWEWNDSGSVPNLIRSNWGTGELALGNVGDEVILLDPTMRVVDVLVYGTGSYPGVVSWGDVSGVYNGNSLERWPAHRDSDNCARDFRIRYAPDPGHAEVW